MLAWLAPEPIPLFLFEAEPLAEAIPEPREALAGLAGYSLARFDAAGDAVLVHRLVQEITRGRIPEADRTASAANRPGRRGCRRRGRSEDVRTWEVWTPLAPHAEAVSRYADAAGLAEPTARLMNQLGLYWKARGQFRAAEPLYAPGAGDRRAELRPRPPRRRHPPQQPGGVAAGHQPAGRGRAAVCAGRWRSTSGATARTTPTSPSHLNNLAALLQATNRLAEAEPLYRRSIPIMILFQRRTGHEHPRGRLVLNNYRVLLQVLGKTTEQIEQQLRELDESVLSEGKQGQALRRQPHHGGRIRYTSLTHL